MKSDQVAEKCLAHKVRMAARRLTRLYDEALRPTGVTSSQFSLLAAIDEGKPESISILAEWLDTDRTTLTRNLAVARGKGWVRTDDHCGSRGYAACLTPEGEEALLRAKRAWQGVQKKLKTQLGADQWTQVSATLTELSVSLNR